MGFLTDCTTHVEVNGTFRINVPLQTFIEMEVCTKDMYKADTFENCEYKDAQCAYTRMGSLSIEWMDCEFKRKGSSSWRDMRDKPSFKVKKLKKSIAFDEGWRDNKVTLNNNAHFTMNNNKFGEVDAYNTFRAIGKLAVPEAMYVHVELFVDDILLRVDTYTMLESLKRGFMEKHFVDNYVLHEVESDELQERKEESDNVVGASENISYLRKHLAPPMSTMNQSDMIRYYVGELLIGHWDGACLINKRNNYYIGYSFNKQVYTMIPAGLDQTYQACLNVVTSSPAHKPNCEFMQDCFSDTQCLSMYENIYNEAKRNTKIRKIESCFEELLPSFYVIGVTVILLPFLLFVFYRLS
jgi:hypothetical protein